MHERQSFSKHEIERDAIWEGRAAVVSRRLKGVQRGGSMLRRSVDKGPLASCHVNSAPRGDSCLGSANFETVSGKIRRAKRDRRGGQPRVNAISTISNGVSEA